MNTLKTTVLMLLMMLFVLFVGQWLGGRSGLIIALAFGSIGNIAAYWFSDKIVLMTSGAKPLDEKDAPQVYRIVASIAQAKGIPVPKVYLMDTPMLNAFATGRNPSHAAVAVTSGILEALDERELAGVLAHEISHILHRDILIATLVSVMAGAIYTLIHLARFAAIFGGSSRDDDRGTNPIVLLVMMIVAPLAAMLIQMAISRSREFDAD
jgi:heat shock protein HtpX